MYVEDMSYEDCVAWEDVHTVATPSRSDGIWKMCVDAWINLRLPAPEMIGDKKHDRDIDVAAG